MNDLLFEENLPLVHKVAAQRYLRAPADIDYDDLYQEGAIGLLRVSRQFEPDRGFKFSTYAWKRIRGQIQDYLQTLGPLQLRGMEGPREAEFHPAWWSPNGIPFFIRWPHDVRAALHTALEALTEREQQIILLYYADEMSFKEIGEELGLSKSRIQVLYLSTMRKLQAKLKDFR